MLLKNYRRFKFLSTPSARRATQKHMQMGVKRVISIHALREEGDLNPPTQEKRPTNFYPRPPRGGRRYWVFEGRTDPKFLSTPSARRATPGFEQLLHDLHHFYPRPPRGGRQHRRRQTVWKDVFLSTPSARRATFPLVGDVGDHLISIHALREEGDPRLYRGTADAGDFYPRPPRGGRLEQQAAMSYNSAISIHALREEGDARTRAIMCLTFTFLSTPSARRATTAYQRQTCSDTDFYPRPPRGGRPLALSLEPCDQLISIHALREEGDWMFYLFLVSL